MYDRNCINSGAQRLRKSSLHQEYSDDVVATSNSLMLIPPNTNIHQSFSKLLLSIQFDS